MLKKYSLNKALSSLGLLAGIAIISTTCSTQSVNAEPIYWTDWTSATPGFPGSAEGIIILPDGSIQVNYLGELAFAQTDGGINYWDPAPGLPYINNPVVDNPPPASDILALSYPSFGNFSNQITFSQAITNPIMAINSLGQNNVPVSYTFDTPFQILSYNDPSNPAHWGQGLLTQSGNTLTGVEGTGVIQFMGTYSSISFNVDNYEYWHGFTVGTKETLEPSSIISLLAFSLLATASKLQHHK